METLKSLAKYYWLSALITVALLAATGVISGLKALGIISVLAVLEVSLSFDNAVVNAVVLRKLSHKWREIFLTVGILIAVIGMRIVFPVVIVGLTAHVPFMDVANMAIDNPHHYGELLHKAHPVIAIFAGTYLAQIGLDYFFTNDESSWLKWLERPLRKAGRLDNLSSMIAGTAALVIALIAPKDIQVSLLIAGFMSVLLYQAVAALNNIFEDKNDEREQAEKDELAKNGSLQLLVGKAAFFMFLYLEVQDAMFSFDGVAGAFAITSSVVYIAIGLFIGALFVRSMTIHFVETNKLEEFDYLENGAFWAIVVLAGLMLYSVFHPVSEAVTGLSTGGLIVASLIWSKYFPEPEGNEEDDTAEEPDGFDEDTASAQELANKA